MTVMDGITSGADISEQGNAIETATREAISQTSPVADTWPLGVSRPPLELADLPTPEQAFNIRRLGLEELILIVLGPGVIGLGLSIGSGEWILGPLTAVRYGMPGIFWIVLVSIVLQVFYNVELARYTLATGEPPVVGLGRTPPGYWLWIPLALVCLFASFILGSWSVSAGSSLYQLFIGRNLTPADAEVTRIIAIGLMLVVIGLLFIGRKIERNMEAVQAVFLPYFFIGMFMVTIAIVPAAYIGKSLQALFIPSLPPHGVDATLLGALAGFAALASGLNFMFIGYYRDKGYGMGSLAGYLSTWVDPSPQAPRSVGITFHESEINTRRWKRWFRLLVLDQWGIYFIGALLGILLPTILFSYLLVSTQTQDVVQSEFLFTVTQLLSQRFGELTAIWVLVLGFVIMFSTQIAVLELLARNLTDGLYGASRRFRGWLGDDPRKFYFPAMLVIILTVSIIIHLSAPEQLSLWSANLANFAAILFPLAMIYLNRQLPRPARITWWSYLVLILNALFFGFFFVNFVVMQATGSPLVRF